MCDKEKIDEDKIEYDQELLCYRAELIAIKNKLHENYDKLVVALSGGALALSITFLKDLVEFDNILFPYLLIISWGFFVASIACVLLEILFGIEAQKRAIKQTDDGSIYISKPGGWLSGATVLLRYSAAILVLLGLLSISIFSFCNINSNKSEGVKTDAGKETSASATETVTAIRANPKW